MKTLVYFLSGTGNSYKIAEVLSSKLEHAKLVPVCNAAAADMTDDVSSIGFVFPVLMFGIPRFIKETLTVLSSSLGGKYVFFVASNGGMVAGSFHQIEQIIKKKNVRAAYHSFVVNRKDFNEIEWNGHIEDIVHSVRNQELKKPEPASFFDTYLLTGIINKLGNRFMNAKFTVSDACTGCEICQKICPVNNIQMVGGKPRWGTNCNLCYGCINWCPVNAISAKTANSFIYKSPLVKSAKELFIR